jgi:homoserine kinase
VAALAGRPEQLLRATRDWLHQDYRRPAMPESLALVDALRADGIAAIVSGAGPTVLAFGATDTSSLVARCPDGWACHDLTVDAGGATLLT